MDWLLIDRCTHDKTKQIYLLFIFCNNKVIGGLWEWSTESNPVLPFQCSTKLLPPPPSSLPLNHLKLLAHERHSTVNFSRSHACSLTYSLQCHESHWDQRQMEIHLNSRPCVPSRVFRGTSNLPSLRRLVCMKILKGFTDMIITTKSERRLLTKSSKICLVHNL